MYDIFVDCNGGVILKESHLGRDAFVASVIILNHLANKDLSMNRANSTIPKFFMLKEKVELNDKFDSNLISDKVKSEFPSYDFNEIDARLTAGWYVHSGQRKRYLKSIMKDKKG